MYKDLKKNKLARQFTKYMLGGSVYFWVGYLVFSVCYSGIRLSWLPAKFIADVIGLSLNYLAQRYWVFNSEYLRLSEMQHAHRYLFIEIVGFVLDYAIIGGLKAIGITPYIGFFVSAGFFSVWSFVWYKFWVFPEKKKPGII